MHTEVKGLCSICCVSYNHAAFIQSSIESMWAQEYSQIEIIALDDGSSDRSASILDDLKKKSTVPMTVIVQKNSGNVGRNFNTAFYEAKGEFVLFMSLDDCLKPNAISEKIAIMGTDKSVAFVANSKITGINDRGEIVDTVPPLALDSMVDVTIDDLLALERDQFGSFYIQGAVFRSDIVENVGAFDEEMVGDDIILRTRVFRFIQSNHEYSFRIFKDSACYYRMHDNNMHKNSYRQVKTVALYLDKYWPGVKSPDMLRNWVRHTVKNSDIKTVFRMFCISPRTAAYLLDAGIWYKLAKMPIKKIKRTLLGRRA